MSLLSTPASLARALATCAAICLLAPAQAQTIVQDLNFAFGPLLAHDGSDDVAHIKSQQETMLFHQFDPSLGTLTAARWELTSAYGAFGNATFTSHGLDPDALITGSFSLSATLNSRANSGGGLLGTGGEVFSASRTANGSCNTSVAAGTCSIGLELGDSFDGVLQAVNLSELIGVGSFEQGVDAVVGLDHAVGNLPINNGAMTSFGQLIWADRDDRGAVGHLRLVYEYEVGAPVPAVPEPSTYALMGIGVMALLAHRRPRRR